LRLAFAVAAHLEPEILVVDEVLAVGDAAFQAKCMGKMGDVALQGRTVVFVSHNLAAISALCSSAMLIQSGRLVHFGSPLDVLDRYLSAGVTQSGNVNLRDRAERHGTGVAKITHLAMHNDRNETGDNFKSGDSLSFALCYEAPNPLRNVDFEIK